MSKIKLNNKCLHEVFQEIAVEYPDNIAISSASENVSYRNLNEYSNSLAHHLLNMGLKAGSLVGLYMDPCIEMIAGVLAIMKAGGAYIPIDPKHSSDRASFMVADTSMSMIITKQKLELPEAMFNKNIVFYDYLDQYTENFPIFNPEPRSNESDLAYIIFTSGSTGKPKGVMTEHRNVTRLYENTKNLFNFDHNDVWCLFHSIGFDFSVWEVWGALLFGGHLVIIPYEVSRSTEAMLELITDRQVTVLNQTPSMFRQIIKEHTKNKKHHEFSLRHIIFGGERFDTNLIKPWVELHGFNKPKLVNMYGLTESTIHATYKEITEEDMLKPEVSPIGKPIEDLGFLVINTEGEQVKLGSPGELYISGPGLARGYLNQPELSSQKFIEDLLNTGKRYYSTGDLVSQSKNGEYFYLGRNDDQIKIRGFRVEPFEIEHCLMHSNLISTIKIYPHDYGEKDVRLIAYYCSDGNKTNSIELENKLRLFAKKRLPIFMRPSKYIKVQEFPQTMNGKIDYEALSSHLKKDSFQIGPSNITDLKSLVREIMADILESENFNDNDDFFDLGGTSLSLNRFIERVTELTKTPIDIISIINHVSVQRITQEIDDRKIPTDKGES